MATTAKPYYLQEDITPLGETIYSLVVNGFLFIQVPRSTCVFPYVSPTPHIQPKRPAELRVNPG